MDATESFLAARNLLLDSADDYERAYREFSWPRLERFNWALDYFDRLAAGNSKLALKIVDETDRGVSLSFEELSRRSNQVANFLRRHGVERGSRLLLLLPNISALWEVTLAAMKLGAVVSPATLLLTADDLQDRLSRGALTHVVTDASGIEKFQSFSHSAFTGIVVDPAEPPAAPWLDFVRAYDERSEFLPVGETLQSDPFLLYFTSGTTAKPKLVMHSHQSYPIGHLSTMYWLGIRPDDIHFNISSPGWAKHSWSSFFAPWNAGATIFIHQTPRFDAQATLRALFTHRVTSLCAPPTVWRMFILEDLSRFPVTLRSACSAGEPLNPEVIDQIRKSWHLTVRDGYGQTETTAQIGNCPGQDVKVGAMGKPLPGYRIALLDADGNEQTEGEISVKLNPAPAGLMLGYLDNQDVTEQLVGGSFYPTSDVASRDTDGFLWYIGRADDVFKSADYRISPFELESVLIEHEAVAEAAVIPSPDPVRTSVPKACVALVPGISASPELAQSILRFARERVAPYKRIRRIEFCPLPKTISGKIRRVQLRMAEGKVRSSDERRANEFWEEDFAEK